MKGNAVVTFGFRRRLAVRAGLAERGMTGDPVAATDSWREPKRRVVLGRIVFMPQLERSVVRHSPSLANERPFLAVLRRGRHKNGTVAGAEVTLRFEPAGHALVPGDVESARE
jgi:hypothetical protein